ncbi:S8 family serine peptidase [candidate division KSB1 bacterium]|nr:S8 family serine peptidase [candidate division KSB1 bacterium]
MRLFQSCTLATILSALLFCSSLAQNLQTLRIDNMTISSFIATDKSHYSHHLSSDLNELYDLQLAHDDYLQFASMRGLKIVDESVVVTLLPESGHATESIAQQLAAYGVTIEARAARSMRCRIPLKQLKNIAENVSGINRICNLIRPVLDNVQGEGIALMNADEWQASGFDGTDVKVAVIDGGFDNLTEAQANGDIPATYYGYDYTGLGLESETVHGTAVAEAIYDIAPGADYSFYHIGDLTDMELAVDDLVDRGVNVVNHSLGWFLASYYDGTGPVCDVAADATANGVVWCNSAGNGADSHYRAVFANAGSNYHDMDGSGTVLNFFGPEPGYVWLFPAGYSLYLYMNWDDYPASDQDYDLYLYRYTGSSWVQVASSTNRQSVTTPTQPVEVITYTNTVAEGKYAFVVRKYSATENVDFTVFTSDPIAIRVPSSSLADPACYEDVVAVGAIASENYASGPQQEYSSQGPTTDGRDKPDVTGPDHCNSFTYGYWAGTSVSSPYVAGVCALVFDRFPESNGSDVRDYLYSQCVQDVGDPGFDYVYGYGKVVLPEDPIAVNLASFAAYQIGNAVAVQWTTASEVETAGFFVQRSKSQGKGFVRIHDQMIAAKGTPAAGASYEFLDRDRPEKSYYYRLEEVMRDGHSSFKSALISTISSVEDEVLIPLSFALQQNYPNPFNPQTTIRYELPTPSAVKLIIYDMNGCVVRTLVNGDKPGGMHDVIWDGKDEGGQTVSSGLYICRFTTPTFNEFRKMTYLK